MNSRLRLKPLPDGWKYIPLEDCITDKAVAYGIVQPGSHDEEGIPIIRVNNIRDGRLVLKDVAKVSNEIESKYVRTRLRGGEVLLTLVGSIGQVAVASPELAGWNVARAIAVMRVRPDIGSNWIRICLQSPQTQGLMREVANTTVQATINLRDVRTLPVPFPPHNERRAIVEMIQSLDNKIDLNSQMNATLEKIAQALFKSWFVDFDPVRARSKGQPPESMDLATAALFPNEFEKCGLEMIPKGWSAQSFGSLVELTIGGDWGTEQANDTHQTKVAVIRGTDIPTLRSGSCEGVPRRYVQSNKLLRRKLKDGDIIIEVSGGSRDQATGRSLYITHELLSRFEEPAIPASFCRLLRGVSKEVSLLLAIHLRYLYDNGGTWKYQSQSTGISNFQTSHFLNNEKVIIPDQKVLSKFWEIIRPLVQKQSSNETITLTKIRDSLIPKLLSGQLRIPGAEKFEGGPT